MDYTYTVHGILQARILEWVAFSLFQGIFPTQGSNPGLPHCGQILYLLSHQGSPKGHTNEHMKRGSTSLAIRRKQMKTRRKMIRGAKMKKSESAKGW